MKNKNLCAIIGENPEELEFGYDEEYYTCVRMKFRLVTKMKELIDEGCTEFVSTLDQGAAMWGAEACKAMKALGDDVHLIAAPTHEHQAAKWHPERRERYFDLLETADEVIDPNGEAASLDYIFAKAGRMIVLGDAKLPRLAEIIERAREAEIDVLVV